MAGSLAAACSSAGSSAVRQISATLSLRTMANALAVSLMCGETSSCVPTLLLAGMTPLPSPRSFRHENKHASSQLQSQLTHDTILVSQYISQLGATMEIKHMYEIFVRGVGRLSFRSKDKFVLDVVSNLHCDASQLKELREAIDRALELSGAETVSGQKTMWWTGDPEPTDVLSVYDCDGDYWNSERGVWRLRNGTHPKLWEELVNVFGPLTLEHEL